MGEPLEVAITLTFSSEDADVIDLVARALKKSRDAVVAEMLVEPVRRHMASTISEMRLAILGVDERAIEVFRRLRRRTGG